MFFVIDFGVERVLVHGSDMAQALKRAWKHMISNYDETPDRAVESFIEDVGDKPSESTLLSFQKSCRDYGYKWTELAVKSAIEVSPEEFEKLRSDEKLKEIDW